MIPRWRRTGIGIALAALVVLAFVAGCDAVQPQPSVGHELCVRTGLDQLPDLPSLFADPAFGCVIVFWDTNMDGAGPLPDGGIGTPAALAAAARARGFSSPCETTVNPVAPSLDRAWFVGRFGALDPKARFWGATLFLRDPVPDGVNPTCVEVTPPR